MKAIEWIFLISGGLTVAYMTKLFVAIFIEKNAQKDVQGKFDAQKHYMNAGSTFALAGSALVLLIWGLLPRGLMDRAAAMGQTFMGLEETGHRVSYFRRADFDRDRDSCVLTCDPKGSDGSGRALYQCLAGMAGS